MGKGSAMSGRVSDPRPLGDRAFANQCIRSLIKYLTEHGYNSAISPKILTRPTNKQFLDIMTFLIHQIDPHFVIGQKYETDIALFLKGIRCAGPHPHLPPPALTAARAPASYPVGISKSSLTAVGSPHTWPNLLACMAWMVELLTYDEEVAANEHVEGGDPNDDGEKLFLDYLGKSYQAFMWYDDGKYEALDEELRETFQGRTAGLKREAESLQEELEALKSEHATLSADKSPVTTLKSRRAELLGDRKKFEELVSKLEERHATAKSTLDARRADLSAKGACGPGQWGEEGEGDRCSPRHPRRGRVQGLGGGV